MATSVAHLAQSALSTHLAALLEHEPLARAGADIEGVHQMRVATRRLRAALQVFADVVPADVDALRAELSWLASALGAVRDLDVQLVALCTAADTLEASTEVVRPLLAWFEARHVTARQQLVETLDTPRYAALIGALAALESAAPWHVASPTASVPDRLRARYRRFRKAARSIDSPSAPAELHRARIRAKQLRYTLEFTASDYGKPARRLIKSAVTVQDVLGAIQDAAVMDQRLQALSAAGGELPPASVFLAGQLAQHFAQRAALARAGIPRAKRGLKRARWRKLARTFPTPD